MSTVDISLEESEPTKLKPSGFKHPLNDPTYSGIPTPKIYSDGPTTSRGFTDCLMLIVFSAFWFGTISIAIYAYKSGTPSQLLVAYDSDGNPCGSGPNTGYSYIYFANPYSGYLNQTVCLQKCPSSTDYTTNCSVNSVVTTCPSNISASPPYFYQTVPLFDILCFPNISNYTDTVEGVVNLGAMNEGFSDIKTAWWAILVTGIIALVLSFIYVAVIRHCAVVFTWSVIFLYLLGLSIFGVICLQNSTNTQYIQGAPTLDNYSQGTQQVLAVCSFALLIFSLIMIVCYLQRIRLAIAVLKCSAQFVENVPSALTIPPLFFFLSLGFYFFWVFTIVYIVSLSSTGKGTPGNLPFDHLQWTSQIRGFVTYYIFGLYWNHMFLMAVTQFILAAATVIWYFSSSEGRTAQKPVSRALCWAIFYHLGSIAFGSLVITFVELIQLLVNLVYGRLKQKHLNAAEQGSVSFCVSATTCCLDCFERFVRFVNKHAYIQIAMTGKSFCGAAHDAFFLAARNSVRFGIVHGLGDIFIWIGTVFITFLSSFLGYTIITKSSKISSQLESPFYPTVCFVLLTYVIASSFMSVYGIASDTIIHCFCMDEEMHEDAKHAPQLLKEFVHYHLPKEPILLNTYKSEGTAQ